MTALVTAANLGTDFDMGAQVAGKINLAVTPQLKTLHTATGGGTIAVDGSGNLSWSTRFIVGMGGGNGATYATDGYFSISQPASGTVITGVGGASNVTVTAAGISMSGYTTLYYILPLGSSNGTVSTNYRVASYSAALVVPANWIPVATFNPEQGGTLTVLGRYALKAGDSIDTTAVRPGLTAPTPPTTDNSTKIATTANVESKIKLRVRSLAEYTAVDFTGVADSTAAVQQACNDAVAGNYELAIPPGEIKLTAPITVSGSLRIRGARPQIITATSNTAATHGSGTWFHLAHSGKGFAFTSPTTGALVFGSMVHQIGTFRDQPTPGSGAYTPGNFDFDWSFTYHVVDIDVVALNATNGIDFANAGQSRVRSFMGQPLSIGIRALNNYDVIAFDRIHLWPWWSFNAQVLNYMTNNADAVQVGRCDNLVMKTLFAYQYSNAFHVVKYAGDGTGYNPAGTLYNGQITCLDADSCTNGVLVDSSASGAQFSIADLVVFSPTQATYAGLQSNGLSCFGPNANIHVLHAHFAFQGAYAVRVDGNASLVRMCAVLVEQWGSAIACAALQATGTGAKVSVEYADVGGAGGSPNGVGVFGPNASDGVAVTISALTAPALDTSSTAITIANGATAQLAGSASGMVNLVSGTGDGSSALFLIGGGGVALAAQSGAIFVASSAPPTGKIGLYYDSNAQRYTIINNQGSAVTIFAALFKVRPFV